MNSSRPYLLRGLYEWIVDNDCTPHLLVSTGFAGVQVPAGYASDGKIVLNLSPSAVRNLLMENQAISFEARFGGKPQALYIPTAAVMAIYAQENGQGMVFELDPPKGEESGFSPDDDPPSGEPPKSGGRPCLKVIK